MKKSYLFSLIVFSFSLFLISLTLSLFTSCTGSSTNSLAATATTATTGSRTTAGDTAPPVEVKCDKDDDDTSKVCSDSDNCEDTCDEIYDSAREESECEELTTRQVGYLEDVYELLVDKTGDLEKLSEEKGDYKLEHLQCYLSIGGKGWIKAIKTDETSSNDDEALSSAEAKDILEWIAEEKKVAAMLTGDTNDGVEIVEELLLKMLPDLQSGGTIYSTPSTGDKTIKTTTQITEGNTSSKTKEGLWKLDHSTKKILIRTHDSTASTEEIELDNVEDAELYDALSYRNLDSDNNDNIFSLATDENNPNLFDLAFSLLDEVCNEAKDDDEDERIACKRAILCWTNQLTDEDIWETIEDIDDINDNNDRQDALDDNFGDEDDCEARDFAELFN